MATLTGAGLTPHRRGRQKRRRYLRTWSQLNYTRWGLDSLSVCWSAWEPKRGSWVRDGNCPPERFRPSIALA